MFIVRHGLFNSMLLINILCLLVGGNALWLVYACLALGIVLLDQFLGLDLEDSDSQRTRLLNALLFLTVPMLALNIIAFNWQMSSIDFCGIGLAVKNAFGWDIVASKNERSLFQTIGAYLSLGLLYSIGTTVAHELTHRVWSRPSLIAGRWLLAPSLDTGFAIEHVHGHHANIGTPADPATARRHESVLAFIVRCTIGSVKGAFHIEKRRLAKKRKKGPWTFENAFLRGQLMSLGVAAIFILAQGWFGLVSFLILAVQAKIYLETVTYIEHYGLVRVPGQAVQPKHSWNCNNKFSLWLTFNLTRHSHHHAKAVLPYWKLKPMDEAPSLPFGYMTMIFIAHVPPLYKKMMEIHLEEWARVHATPEERDLLARQRA